MSHAHRGFRIIDRDGAGGRRCCLETAYGDYQQIGDLAVPMTNTGRRFALAVAALATMVARAPGASGALVPIDPPASRAALAAEIDAAYAKVASYQDGPIDRYELPEYRQAVAELWTLLARWALEFLQAHPAADGAAVAADLASLASKTKWFEPSVVRLGSGSAAAAVVAIDAGFSGGTFFVVSAGQTDRSAAAWSIRNLAEKNFALHNDLGAWAFLVAGVHDGPLGARVLPLPAARSGCPRFLIDAVTHPSMGLDMPGQVSVWEWTGRQAKPEFIQSYWTTVEVGGLRREGDLLRVPTKELTKTFYSCGSCDDPKGAWTLRLTPDGVSDLGHAYDEPLLGAADELLARLARREDASALASARVVARLTSFVRELRQDREREAAQLRHQGGAQASEQASAPPDPYDGLRSMLGSWKVSVRGNRRVLDLATDDWHLRLTFEKRGTAYYATAVAVL